LSGHHALRRQRYHPKLFKVRYVAVAIGLAEDRIAATGTIDAP
jgi:hypothetical protein